MLCGNGMVVNLRDNPVCLDHHCALLLEQREPSIMLSVSHASGVSIFRLEISGIGVFVKV